MLKTRIITAIIGIPLLLGALYLGGLYWIALITLLVSVGLWEYLTMVRHAGAHPLVMPTYFLAYMLLFRLQLGQELAGLLFGGWLLMTVVMLIRYPESKLYDLALSFFGAFYCGLLFSYALAFSNHERAVLFLVVVLFLTWASDIGGYLFGRLWGKKKLAPKLSPAKTWEGAAGAVLLTIATATLFKYLLPLEAVSLGQAILLGLIASLAAQLGDLFESSIKRYAGLKDSGNIIPGHGGVLDRFDSFMLVLPIVYYFQLLLP